LLGARRKRAARCSAAAGAGDRAALAARRSSIWQLYRKTASLKKKHRWRQPGGALQPRAWRKRNRRKQRAAHQHGGSLKMYGGERRPRAAMLAFSACQRIGITCLFGEENGWRSARLK